MWLNHFKRATEDQIIRGSWWYQDAHNFSENLAKENGLKTQQIAAIIAALSPMQKWETNKQLAVDTLKYGKVELIRTLNKNCVKALNILDGNPINTILKGEKVRNFYLSILNPKGPFFTIDRHMLRAAKIRKETINHVQYRLLLETGLYEAKLVNLSPPQFQAIVWLVEREKK